MAAVRAALVTGASGFIGRVLCQRLREQGVDVYALVRRPVGGPWQRVFRADIAGGDLPAEVMADVDTVFHLAGKVHAVLDGGDETSYRDINVDGTRRVLRAALQAGVERFVFWSSVKAMGEGGDDCMDETWEPAPRTAYGRSKLEAERLVTEAGRRHGLHTVNLRLPLVYGTRGKGNLSQMLDAVARGRFPPLPEVGNRRSMVHVTDVAEAALLAARRADARGETYIVTDGAPYSTREIYVLMCRALGRRVPPWTVPAPVLRGAAMLGDGIGRASGHRSRFDSGTLEKLMGSAWYSSAKIERELGFRPSLRLEEALPEMIASLDRNSKVRVSV